MCVTVFVAAVVAHTQPKQHFRNVAEFFIIIILIRTIYKATPTRPVESHSFPNVNNGVSGSGMNQTKSTYMCREWSHVLKQPVKGFVIETRARFSL